jgi:(p)ppGpp synthase/HD superfamily hydrolase
MLSKAILIATQAHAGDFDRGGNPYILHPLTVMHKLKTDDEELMSIAVLHDVVEDCTGKAIIIDGRQVSISYQMLEKEGMSTRVIDGVKALTKVPGQTYEEYQAAVLANQDAIAVKKEDLRTNSDLRRLKGVTEKDIARAAKYMLFYAMLEGKTS